MNIDHTAIEFMPEQRTEFVGRCNGCRNTSDPQVTMVLMPTITFRVCDKCAKLLASGLMAQVQKPEELTSDAQWRCHECGALAEVGTTASEFEAAGRICNNCKTK